MADRRLVIVVCKWCGWHKQADADLFNDEMRTTMMGLYDDHLAAHAESWARALEFSAGDDIA
jgi:hypothetical protein